ncbi:MAG: hypothetical protein JSV47_12660, partial [Deltaproteobacteria bacterium]
LLYADRALPGVAIVWRQKRRRSASAHARMASGAVGLSLEPLRDSMITVSSSDVMLHHAVSGYFTT